MKSPRSYASDTSVSVDRSRAEINHLLREWSCAEIAWTDHLAESRVSVEFTWHREDALYRVRFTLQVPKKTIPTKHPPYERPQTAKEQEQAARSVHRLLLLKLKADLNAAQAGLAKVEEIFLPWMVDRRGKTVADLLLPRLKEQFAALSPGAT
ncbi:hypothetical protein HY375_00670 [Candidatus Berkelbacteria bacterium]|nr:hypothetical protein [Candidatus Berkelbacteria bacterium]